MTYEGKYKALFADDIPGGVLILCSNCDKEHEDYTKWGEQSICPHCKETLRYPEGADW